MCEILTKNGRSVCFILLGRFSTTRRPPQSETDLFCSCCNAKKNILFIFSAHGNSTAVCHFHGDPHLLTFPQAPGEVRSQYWCKTPGENLLLKNKYVQIKVHVSERFWYNEQVRYHLFSKIESESVQRKRELMS